MSKFLLAALLALLAPSAQAAHCSQPAPGLAAEVLAAVNAVRGAQGQTPLAPDPRLDAAAQAHACDMAQNGFFDHRSSSGANVSDRVRAAGVSSCTTAENIAYGWRSARQVMDGWMQSSGHRDNILRSSVQAIGFGYVPASGGAGPWWVQVFARPC